MVMQYRPKRSQKFYAPGRDILGFYRPLVKEVLDLVHARHPDKPADVEKLQMLHNAIINEATAGARKLEMHEIIQAFTETLKDIDQAVVDDYTRLLAAVCMFRYVLGKREVPEHQVEAEELGKAFDCLYTLSVVPPELEEQLKKHLLAYGHIPKIVVENEPPCVAENIEEDGPNGA